MCFCVVEFFGCILTCLSMVTCFLIGNNYLSYVYFCSLYDGFIFIVNIVILM